MNGQGHGAPETFHSPAAAPMAGIPKRSCGTCSSFRPARQECRRRAPVPIRVPVLSENEPYEPTNGWEVLAFYPTVGKDEEPCGEWEVS